MKFNITRSDGSVMFVFNTHYMEMSILYIVLFILSVVVIWSLLVPALLYDIALSMLVALKLVQFLRRKKIKVADRE
mgnify:FL=1